MRKHTTNIRKLTTIAILSAVSAVLMYLQFGLPFLPVHLAFDFSDLPAVIASFAYGPVAGVLVEFLKNFLHLPTTTTFGIGELSNFLHGACFVFPAGYLYHLNRSKQGALIGAVSGMLSMTIFSFPINYFLTIPLFIRVLALPAHVILGMYQAVLPSVEGFGSAILIFHLPLTFVKGLVCMVIAFLIYKRISPLLHGTQTIDMLEK